MKPAAPCNTLEAARGYLKRGWQPTPVHMKSKKPVLEDWPKLRLNESDLPKYFDGHKKNIGLVLGEPSGNLVDVDLDAAEALAVADNFLPHTGMIHGRESKPRSHRWYRIRMSAKTVQFRDMDEAGTMLLELRSTGSQTVVPPSTHESGEEIRWESSEEPATLDEKYLLKIVATLAACVLMVRHWPTKHSSRHEIALALAGFLGRMAMAAEEVERFVGSSARAAGDEEWSGRARDARDTMAALVAGKAVTGAPKLGTLVGNVLVQRLQEFLTKGGYAQARAANSEDSANSASGTAHSEHADWEPPTPFHEVDLPPFPTDALPEPLRAFVDAEATATQTPPDLTGMLVLSAVAAATARKVRIQVKEGYTEPVNIFTATALPPANRKSQVFTDVVAPLEEFERDEAARMKPEILVAQARYDIAQKKLKMAQESAARNPQDPEKAEKADHLARELAGHKVPPSPRIIADDTTPEQLASMLHDQDGRMAVLSAEGGVFGLMAGRYSQNGAPNFEVFLKGHAGDMLRVDRRTRPAEHVDRPALTLGLAVQPGVIEGLAGEPSFRGRGLLARFLYSLPRSFLGRRNVDAPPVLSSIRSAYHECITKLLRMTLRGSESDAE